MSPRVALLLFALLLSLAPRASAHRVDEYLQAAFLSVEPDRLHVDLYLTPGIAVLPVVLPVIDTDRDGTLSPAEQQAYVRQILRDLTFTLDGQPLTPQIVSFSFPPLADLRDGLGDIHLELAAALPPGGPARHLTLENRHQSALAAYQVNSLVSSDSSIRLVAQHRNESQSSYTLDYTQPAPAADSRSLSRLTLSWLPPALLFTAVLALTLALRPLYIRPTPACSPVRQPIYDLPPRLRG